MRKIYICLAFLFFGLIGISDLHAQYLIVKFQDGTKESKEISLLQDLKFPDNLLKINYYSGLTDSYDLSLVSTLYFQSYSTGTEDLSLSNNQEIFVYPNPATDIIYMKNAPANLTLASVYRIDGVLVLQKQISSDYQSIDIGNLTKGIYIIRVDNQVIKFIKQ